MSSDTIYRITGGAERFHAFSKSMNFPEVNVIARLEFELAYYESIYQYATGTRSK